MSMIYFKIGNTDFSAAVDKAGYDINDVQVYSSWTDVNKVEHREFVRTRLMGRLTLGYASTADFAAALSAINTALSAGDGHTSCTVWVNNTGATDTGDCYLTILGSGQRNKAESRQWLTLDIEIYER